MQRHFGDIDGQEEYARYHNQQHTRTCRRESLNDQAMESSPLFVHLNDLIITRL
jgi:hypothetical protein